MAGERHLPGSRQSRYLPRVYIVPVLPRVTFFRHETQPVTASLSWLLITKCDVLSGRVGALLRHVSRR